MADISHLEEQIGRVRKTLIECKGWIAIPFESVCGTIERVGHRSIGFIAVEIKKPDESIHHINLETHYSPKIFKITPGEQKVQVDVDTYKLLKKLKTKRVEIRVVKESTETNGMIFSIKVLDEGYEYECVSEGPGYMSCAFYDRLGG